MDELNNNRVQPEKFPESPAAPPPVPPASNLSSIFIGPQGLRAGWRLLMYFALAAVFFAGVVALERAMFPHQTKGFRAQVVLVNEMLLFFATLIPALIMGTIEKRSLRDYGLPGRGIFGKRFWLGSIWGILAITVLMLTLRGLHGFYFGTVALHGIRIAKWAVFWGGFFLFVGFFEEFFFRGYTLFTLSTGIGFWPAALVLSVIFGAVHLQNPGEQWVGGLAAGLIGLFFCLTLRRTGDLWFAIGMHLWFDWGETFLYSVPDSGFVTPGHLLNSVFHGPRWLTGGSVGPEGSVLVFGLIGLLFVIFNWMYPQAVFPVERQVDSAVSEMAL
jgi:membrane protease YdiL (CAAX protease family)